MATVGIPFTQLAPKTRIKLKSGVVTVSATNRLIRDPNAGEIFIEESPFPIPVRVTDTFHKMLEQK